MKPKTLTTAVAYALAEMQLGPIVRVMHLRFRLGYHTVVYR